MSQKNEYVYDKSKVKNVLCQGCQQPIGEEPYVEWAGVARFGMMFFYHKRCSDAIDERERQERKEKKTR